MKLKVSVLTLLIASIVYAGIGFTTAANNTNVAERFSAPEASVQTGVTGKYNFDKSHSAIGFKVKHYGLVDVPGYFRDFTGAIDFNAEDPSKSSVTFSAKMTSVDTGVAGRDNHLRTADFFEVEKYPEMTFVSKKVEKHGAMWHVTGDLTMKGVTKSVSFPFNIAGFLPDRRSGGTIIGVTAETTINRRDFGVNYGSNLPNGVAALSDNVKVELNIEAINVPEKK